MLQEKHTEDMAKLREEAEQAAREAMEARDQVRLVMAGAEARLRPEVVTHA